MNKKTQGILFVLAASIIWAIEAVFVRLANKNSIPLKTAAFALFFGSIVALIYSIIRKHNFNLDKKQWKSMWIIILGGTVLAQPLYYLALSKTAIVNAVLISHTQPIFIIIFGYFIFKENLTKHDYLGGFLILIATLLVISRTFGNIINLKFGSVGDLLVLGSTIMWSLTIFQAKMYFEDVPASIVGALRFGIASLFLLFYLLLFYNVKIDSIYQIIVGILIGTGIIFYYEGLKRIKAAQVAFTELASPFFAAIFGFYFFSETITLLQVMALPILVVGLWFISRREK